MSKPKALLRWTVEMVSREFGKHPRTVKQALVEGNIAAGDDEKYSSQQVLTALMGNDQDREARTARNQSAIDEAAMMRNERDLQEGRLVYRTAVRDRVTEVFLKAVQIVRGSKMSERDKRELVKTFGEIKMEPRKILEFEKAL